MMLLYELCVSVGGRLWVRGLGAICAKLVPYLYTTRPLVGYVRPYVTWAPDGPDGWMVENPDLTHQQSRRQVALPAPWLFLIHRRAACYDFIVCQDGKFDFHASSSSAMPASSSLPPNTAAYPI